MHYNVFDGMEGLVEFSDNNVFAEFLQTKGLYDKIEINEDNICDLIAILNGQVRISVYCAECKTERVFSMEPIMFFTEVGEKLVERKLACEVHSLQKGVFSPEYRKINDEKWQWKNWEIDEIARVLVFKFVCAMNKAHHLDYVVIADNHTFRKIGQFPSVADLSFPELNEYNKVLDKDTRKELGRAIGLFASGIGAGSYVYLRRIFERLLMQAKLKAGLSIDEESFNKAHVDEKITMLKDYLPETLNSNAIVYGVLSKGIHELSEEQCIEYFPVVKECIFMILDEWEEKRKKEEKEKAIRSGIARIKSQIT